MTPGGEFIKASEGIRAAHLDGRYWAPEPSLVPLGGVRLFHLRSLEDGAEAIIAVPPKKAS